MTVDLAHASPMSICSDLQVREFVEGEAGNFNPYHMHLTAVELFAEVRRRFGDRRVDDLEFWIH